MRELKESIKITGLHIIVSLVSIILSFPFWFLTKYPYLYSGIFTAVYIIVIYNAGWDMGMRDSRKIGEFNPSIKRAVLVGLLSSVISVILFIFRVICPFVFPRIWSASGVGFELMLTDHPVTVIVDVLYKLWFFPCSGFMGKGDFIGYLLPILIIPVVTVISYLFGLKKISWFVKYYNKLVYKDKKKNNK